jgi:hypothetical protein
MLINLCVFYLIPFSDSTPLLYFSSTMFCSKQVIQCRTEAFITYIQSDIEHIYFLPGEQWWALSESENLSKRFTNALTFLEQIGVSDDEMEAAFGRYWKNTLPKYFPDLRIRKYFGNVDFVSPSNGFDFDSSETPNEHNIVTKSHLTINNRNWEKLFFDIWDAFARIASLLRSTRKLTSEQQKDLLEDTRNFASVYTTNSSCR